MGLYSIGSAISAAQGHKDGQMERTSFEQGDFLQLLIAQLKNQDPMSPMDDKEFIGQVTQFSLLETTKELSKTLDGYARINTTSMLLGKHVDIMTDDGIREGIVDSIEFHQESVSIIVDGEKYSPQKVIKVSV